MVLFLLKLQDISELDDTYNRYENNTLEDEKGYCAVVGLEDIVKQDYILTHGRYVGIKDEEEDDEAFNDKMARLTSDLSVFFAQSDNLQRDIKDRLREIGFEFR